MQKRFEIDFTKTLKKISKPKINFILACSGGVDSIVLLDLLILFCKKKTNHTLSVVYIDHRLRVDTKKDIAAIKQLTKPHKIPFKTALLTPIKKPSEELLRSMRYKKLNRFVQKKKNTILITAHHADDQVETFLIKLLRGMHAKSYPTIRSINVYEDHSELKGLTVVRPLLAFWKNELTTYAKEHHLHWNEDITNESPQFMRNRIRNELLPQMESIRVGSKKSILRFCESLVALDEKRPVESSKVNQSSFRILKTKGWLVQEIHFAQLKQAIEVLLGSIASKTNHSQWKTVEGLLIGRKRTKNGGGETKLVKFPGGKSILFFKDRVFFRP